MNRQNHFYGLHFDDNGIVYQQIEPVAEIDADTVISNRKQFLRLDVQSDDSELVCKARPVGVLQKARTQPRMYLVGCTENEIRLSPVNEAVPPVVNSHLRDLRGRALSQFRGQS